jgi:ariadne-1
MGDWEPHGSSWYQCNRFDEESSKAAQADLKTSRKSLERYLFYFNRYANHEQSMKLEDKLWQMVEAKQKEMQRKNMTWIEVQVRDINVGVAWLMPAGAAVALSAEWLIHVLSS